MVRELQTEALWIYSTGQEGTRVGERRVEVVTAHRFSLPVICHWSSSEAFMTFSHPLPQRWSLADHPQLPTRVSVAAKFVCEHPQQHVIYVYISILTANYVLTGPNGSKHPLFSVKGQSSHLCGRKSYLRENWQLQTFEFQPEIDSHWSVVRRAIIALQVVI